MSILIIIILTGIFIYAGIGPKNSYFASGKKKVSIVRTNGVYKIYKDGKEFIVKGGAGYTHIKDLQLSGGNTIVCWDTAKIEQVLLQAAQFNIAVILGLDIPGNENIAWFKNENNVSGLYKAYGNILRKYKDHPNLLAWCLGNELIIPQNFSLTQPLFFKEYNHFLKMIHDIDPNHPVATAVMNVSKKSILNIQWRVPALDFICINTYNEIKSIEADLATIRLVWKGPYLISEWAPNGGWEAELTAWEAPIENTSTKKAEQYRELYNKYMPINDPRFLGSLAFYWGSRQEYTPTWYSIFEEDGTPTEIKEVLNDCWINKQTTHYSPNLKFMLIDSLGAKDNIILKQSSIHKAAILFNTDSPPDGLTYRWHILKEGWQYWGRTFDDFKKPEEEFGLLADSTKQVINFAAPLKEGPYRVFVTVYNASGYCATANTPFYVVEE